MGKGRKQGPLQLAMMKSPYPYRFPEQKVIFLKRVVSLNSNLCDIFPSTTGLKRQGNFDKKYNFCLF
jgi:hypothetical protein